MPSRGGSSPDPRWIRRVGRTVSTTGECGSSRRRSRWSKAAWARAVGALVDDGGGRRHQLGEREVAEDDDGDVLAVEALERAQHAEADERGRGEHGGGAVGGGEHRQREGVGDLAVPAAGLDQLGLDDQAGLHECVGVAGEPVLDRGELLGLAEEGDPGVAVADQVAHGLAGALVVGDPYDVLVVDAAAAVDHDDRDVVGERRPGRLVVAEGSDEQGGHAAAHQPLDLHLRAALVHAGGGDEHVHAQLHGTPLGDGDDLTEERVVERVDDDADGRQLAAAEPLGGGVRVVVEGLDGGLHAGDGLGAHPGRAVDDARHGLDREARLAGHVVDGRLAHAGTPRDIRCRMPSTSEASSMPPRSCSGGGGDGHAVPHRGDVVGAGGERVGGAGEERVARADRVGDRDAHRVDPPGALGGAEGGAVGAGGDDGAAGAAGVQLARGRDAAVDEVVALLLDVLVGAAEQQRLDLTDVRADQVGPAGEGGAEHAGGGVDVRGDTAVVGGLDDVGVEGERHVGGKRARAEHGGRAGRRPARRWSRAARRGPTGGARGRGR